MSDISLTAYNNYDNGDQDCLNQYIDALGEDIVPRDSVGDPSNLEENIGDTDTPVRYLKVSGGHYRCGTLVRHIYSSTTTITIPASCQQVYVIAAGAGGNGNLASGAPTGGSGGGTAMGWVRVNPSESVTITISSGNASFGSYATGYAGNAGSSGVGNGSIGGNAFLIEEALASGGFAFPGGASMEGASPQHAGESTLTGIGGSGAYRNGGAGYNDGATGSASGGGGGGGYTAASGSTGGSAGVEVRYYLLPGETDPN